MIFKLKWKLFLILEKLQIVLTLLSENYTTIFRSRWGSDFGSLMRSRVMTQQATTVDELAFTQPNGEQEQQILTSEAIGFLTELVTRFTPQRNKLLAARIHQQQEIDDGKL